MTFHLDYETFSTADLRKVGAYRYANDPSTEILCCAIALGEEEPVVWRADGVWNKPADIHTFQDWLYEISCNPSAIVYAHNAQFEIAVTTALFKKTFGFDAPSLKQWRCTAAMAKRAALPRKLETVAELLHLPELKDSKGAGLIRLFSVMQKTRKTKTQEGGILFRVKPQDQPDKFQQFADYCVQDVRTERSVHKALTKFELKGVPLESFLFDIEMNHRGLPVNILGLHKAKAIIDTVVAESSEEFRNITGFNVTQRDKFLLWLRERGYKGIGLTVADVDSALEEDEGEEDIDTQGLPEEALRALSLRKNTSFAATKKVQAMLDCAGPHDNKVRGTLDWHGPTTGRWAGRLIQPQNFKRPTISNTEFAYFEICNGATADYLRLVYGEPLETIASCIRHFIHDTDAGCFLNADYASIEARIVCWLADEEEALQEYRNGLDRYVVMASAIYGVAQDHVTKDQRFVGKQAVLGCGFQLSANGLIKGCARYGVDVPVELAERTVSTFRLKHKKLVRLWYAAEAACKNAVNMPNTRFKIGSKCSAVCAETAGMKFLLVALPSGRLLSYPQPRIEQDGRLTFYGQIPGTHRAGRQTDTYGGKLIENITQAVAADVMTHGALNCEREGYRIATLIHDEALAYKREGQTNERFVELLTDLPVWAAGLPIVAEGKEVPFYTK